MKQNIFSLALDFFQAPTEHRDLLDPGIPLPQDVSFLLDALVENKDPRSDQHVDLPEDLRAAIQFLIERVFFAPGADCYRVLGLGYNASPEEIRRHYNQLLNIFALDRVDRSGEWNTNYATQINRAYSVLRDPERRLAYDQNLLRASAAPGPAGRAGLAAAGPVEPPRSAGNVSYLNAGIPPVRPAEPELRELPPQVSKAPEVRHQEAPSRNSFIANRIDRVSGIPESSEGAGSGEPAGGERMLPPLEPSLGARDHYPKGIPFPVGEGEKRASIFSIIFSMDKGTKAVLAAVVVVLIVYAVVLFNQITDEETPVAQSDFQTAEAPKPSLDLSGSVIREDADTLAPGIGAEDNPFDQANTAAAVDNALPAGAASPRPGKSGAGNAAVVTAGAAGTPPSAVPSPDSPKSAPSGAQMNGVKAPEKSRTGIAPDADRTSRVVANDVKTPPAGGSPSPARKLESMRQTLQAEAPGPIEATPTTPPVTRTDSGAPRPATRANIPRPVSESVPAPAAPALVAAAPASGEPQAPASVSQSQTSQNDAAISIQELDRLAETFSRAYETGDLRLLVSLFSEDARTNDQNDRAGIENDYRDLFQLSDKRSFTFGRLRWEQDKAGGGLKGEGDFRAMVELKSDHSETSVEGKVVFHVKRAAGGIVITEMIHTYD